MSILVLEADSVEDAARPDVPTAGQVVDSGTAHLNPLVVELTDPVHATGVGISRLEVLRLVGLVRNGGGGLLGCELAAGSTNAHDVGRERRDSSGHRLSGSHLALTDLLEATRGTRELGLSRLGRELLRRLRRELVRHVLTRLAVDELSRLTGDVRGRTRLGLSLAGLHHVLRRARLLRLRLTLECHTRHRHGLSDVASLHLIRREKLA